MSSLKEIRNALADLISPTIEGVSVYPYIVENPNLPALVVSPTDIDFARAFGRGMDTQLLDVYLLFPLADYTIAQVGLDDYVTGAGEKSIRQLVFQNQTLGLPDVSAWVKAMTGYGGQFEAAGVPHLGARLAVEVNTSGTA